MKRATSPKILLVDDDPDDHFFIESVINDFDSNIQIKSVYNGVQALDFLRSSQSPLENESFYPDFILTDLNMPLLNGYELLIELKKDNQLKHIPVFIISTSKQPQIERDCMEHGALKYYLKPISANDLKSIIDDVLVITGIKD